MFGVFPNKNSAPPETPNESLPTQPPTLCEKEQEKLDAALAAVSDLANHHHVDHILTAFGEKLISVVISDEDLEETHDAISRGEVPETELEGLRKEATKIMKYLNRKSDDIHYLMGVAGVLITYGALALRENRHAREESED